MTRKPRPVGRKQSPRPVCACCGGRYGRRAYATRDAIVAIGDPLPAPPANWEVRGTIVRTEVMPPMPPEGPTTEDDAEAYVPIRVPGAGVRKGRRVTWWAWDGATYVSPHAPFCSLRCAERFAYAAYRAGFRFVVRGQPS